jgi:hypothetical protein
VRLQQHFKPEWMLAELMRRPLMKFIFAAITLLLSGGTYPIPAARADMSTNGIYLLWQQYCIPQTIHCKATFSAKLTIGQTTQNSAGTYEYWRDGEKFRVLQLVDPSIAPNMRHDIRWDGQTLQWFDYSGSTLFTSESPRHPVPVSGIPLLQPFTFVQHYGADAGALVTWNEIASDATLKLISAGKPISANEWEIAGKDQFGNDCIYQLKSEGRADNLPTSLNAVTAGSGATSHDEFTYQSVPCGGTTIWVPKTIKTIFTDTKQQFVATSSCDITLVEAGAPIPPEEFTMDFQRARMVVDLDRPAATASGSAAPASAPSPVPSIISVQPAPVMSDFWIWSLGAAVALGGLVVLGYGVLRGMRGAK